MVPRAKLYLLEQKEGRARVEEFDVAGWTRILGWVDASKVEPYSSQSLGWGTSGCAGEFSGPSLPSTVAGKLRREVTMTSLLEGGMATTLRADVSVEILARFDDKLFAVWRQMNAQGVATLVVVGWIPSDAVKEANHFAKALDGRLRQPARQTTPRWSEFQVTMRSGPLQFEARADSRGHFRVPATLLGSKKADPPLSLRACGHTDNDDTVSLTAQSRDGLWTASSSLGSSQPKKSVVLDIALAATAK
jgi:hypothetical protein